MNRTFLLSSHEILQILGHIRGPAVHVMDVQGDEFVLDLYGLQFREATPEEIRKFWKMRRQYAAQHGRIEELRLLRAIN